MLPYFFTCNRRNYSRWATLYAVDMLTSLPKTVEDEFKDGHFPVKFTPGKFVGVWSDLAVEMTVIKDTKAKSTGIIGFALQESAVLRWTVTRHILGAYASEMRQRASLLNGSCASTHKQQARSIMTRDETDISKVISHIQINMTDPFNFDPIYTDRIVNISSGLAATAEISLSLLSAFSGGEKLLKKFVGERFELKSWKLKIISRYHP